jgi:pentatricopeptide repeat domain-containing protein 1
VLAERAAKWQLALVRLSVMPEARMVPDEITYSAAISACEKGGQWQLALNLLSLMPDTRLAPDEITHNAATSACERMDSGSWR